MEIVWTGHAQERQQQWEQRLGITKQQIEAILIEPEQIVIEEDVAIAQSRYGNGLLRVVFVKIGATHRILTVYWTNQVRRYWQEENP
jgi:hypothetical protein